MGLSHHEVLEGLVFSLPVSGWWWSEVVVVVDLSYFITRDNRRCGQHGPFYPLYTR